MVSVIDFKVIQMDVNLKLRLFNLILSQDRIKFLEDRFIPLLEKKYKASNVFNKAKEADPTKNKIYLQWICNQLLKTIEQKKTYIK